MKRFLRTATGIILALAILTRVIAAPPAAAAADRIKIIYGALSVGDTVFGWVRYDGKTWTLDEESWKKECATIANAGANAVRILPYAVWDPRPYGRRSQFQPWVYDQAANKWDLSKFNGYYFPILRRIVEIVNAYGMEAWVAWFDGCQLQPGYWTAYSPWAHNLQGITHFYDVKADPFCKAWIRKIVHELEGCRVLWPWGNELPDRQTGPEWVRRVVFPMIKELAIPYNRMTYGFTMDEAPYLGQGKFADKPTMQDTARKYFGEDFPPESNKFKLIREVHKCGTLALDSYCAYGRRPAQAAYWWGGRPVGPFILSDDGVHEWKNPADGGRPDAARWKAMATWALKYSNLGGLEHLPEGGPLEYQVGVVAAIGAAYHATYKAWPENTGKWTYIPPPEYVTVTICKGSGLRPNPYCPETASQKYVKGTEPTKICAVHKKPEDPPPPPGPGPEPPPIIDPPEPECSCSAWLDTEGGKRKPDVWRWILCVFGGAKRCR